MFSLSYNPAFHRNFAWLIPKHIQLMHGWIIPLDCSGRYSGEVRWFWVQDVPHQSLFDVLHPDAQSFPTWPQPSCSTWRRSVTLPHSHTTHTTSTTSPTQDAQGGSHCWFVWVIQFFYLSPPEGLLAFCVYHSACSHMGCPRWIAGAHFDLTM